VHVDREGRQAPDFQIVHNIRSVNGSIKNAVVRIKDYLEDSCFLVALYGNKGFLVKIHDALDEPALPIYAGRRSCPFAKPLNFKDNLVDVPLEEALMLTPYIGRAKDKPEKLRLVLEDAQGFDTRDDVPLNFANRVFTPRRVMISFIPSPEQNLDLSN
jgi:CRISPR system Cascade subunit CasD